MCNYSIKTHGLLAAAALLLSLGAPSTVAQNPAPGVAAPDAGLIGTLSSLKTHVVGPNKLDAAGIEACKLAIDKDSKLFGQNDKVIRAAFDLVAAYDKTEGPLWVAHERFSRGADRKAPFPANDIHWTVYNVMQNIMDFVYTAENIARYPDLINGFKFGSSANFPGAVAAPTNPNEIYRVKISASAPKTVGRKLEEPARRSTGAYLAPGSIATVSVPAALVNKGFKIRVCAQSWNLSNKPSVLRLDRSSLLYDITAADTKVASPLGGGIYIEVPFLAEGGVVELAIKNAVRAPLFSTMPFHTTTLEQWKNVERNQPAPWAEFRTEKFVMQVPSSWIRKLEDPVTLMQNWDKAMDAMNDLMGFPHVQGRETMYLQVDLQMRGSAYFPGYPTTNASYAPKKDYGGLTDHYLIRGPQYVPDHVFHEQGHAFNFVKFPGEGESDVNLLHVAVQTQKFGVGFDEAFRGSRNVRNAFCTLDTTAITWMASENFLAGKPMTQAEKQYQLQGHAKFVEIARLFGWQPLNDYWRSWNEDLDAGRPWIKKGTNSDILSLRLSQKAGCDLTPLLQFWGVPPLDAKALKASVAESKLAPSAKVYDALIHYQSLIPKDKAAFQDLAKKWHGKQPSPTGFTSERGHAALWDKYDETTAATLKQRVQEIIDAYFPNRRPAN